MIGLPLAFILARRSYIASVVSAHLSLHNPYLVIPSFETDSFVILSNLIFDLLDKVKHGFRPPVLVRKYRTRTRLTMHE